MRSLAVVTLTCAALSTSSVAAQWPPERLKNLRVLPADIPIRALIDTMAGFTRALGVRCTYCHAGREGEGLEKYDFVSDEKTEKVKAREMLRMVTAINQEHLDHRPGGQELAARIESYELAFRMQAEAPEAVDL